MGEFSIFHWMIVLAVILIFFRGKRIPEIMKGFVEGIRSFMEGMSGTSDVPTAPPPQVQTPPAAPAQPSSEEKKYREHRLKFHRELNCAALVAALFVITF